MRFIAGCALITVLIALMQWQKLVAYLSPDAQAGIGLALVLCAIFGGFGHFNDNK